MAITDLSTTPSLEKASFPDTLQKIEQQNLITPSIEAGDPLPSQFPTEIVELPSKGLLYPKDHPLASGKIEMKYMTTKEEDILSTKSYIQQGIVFDKLFQSMIITKFPYDDLLLGDRNAIMVAARIYGYGPTYSTKIQTPSGNTQPEDIDLSLIKHKEIDESLITPGSNTFKFTLPISKQVVEFELLTVGMQKQIDKAIEALKKYAAKGEAEANLTTRFRYMIKSIDNNTDTRVINDFINNMRVQDSRAFREFISKVQPDVNLSIELVDRETLEPFRSEITLGVDLFWPDYKG